MAEGTGGPAVSSIVAVDDSTARADPAGRFEPDRDRRERGWDRDAPAGLVEERSGLVKFYNTAKGYGFVVPDDGGPDVFVPGIVLGRAGLGGLETGQRVSVMVEQGKRGLQARDIELI
ncbi:MAG: cold shock domain-containing protein, partial [Rhodospirillales bacterium]|nr:cold shock domain-containing protein [Rhodospirillales bacterium]